MTALNALGNGFRLWKSIAEFFLSPAVYFLIDRRRKSSAYLTDIKLLENGPSRPPHLAVELTNLCNANCVFCAYQFQERPIKTVTMEIFEKAVREFASLGGGGLGLTPVVGDSLIDKEIGAKIRLARSYPEITDIGLTTNGILLNQKLFEELVEAGLTYIYVSMSGFSAKEYKRVYRNDSYKKVTRNLEEIAKSPLRTKCFIEISLRTDALFPWLKADYRKFQHLGYPIGRTRLFDNWSGRFKSRDLPGFMFIRPNPPKPVPCLQLYAGANILADGTMTACGCRDVNADSELILGKIQDVPLTDPWQEGALKKLRQRFLAGDLPKICQDCRAYTPITKADAAHWKK